MNTETTSAAAALLAKSSDELNAQVHSINEAGAEVKRLEALLEAAKQTYKERAGWMQAGHRHQRRLNITATQEALAGGAAGIIVTLGHNPPQHFGGAILKRTPARVTVVSERGEMEFDLKANTYGQSGCGRGDARAYRIDVSSI